MTKPTKRPAPVPTKPAASRPRTRLEQFSTPLLVRLHGLPRWLFPLLTGLLLAGGLLVPNGLIAALLLSLLMLFLLWLVALSWSLLTLVARLLRLAVMMGLLMVIIGRATGSM